jgi:hypothetical protein
MATMGWPYPFRAVGWEDISAFLGDMAARHARFGHMAAIADSVIATRTTSLLAGCTSMHDLVVVSTPIPDPPYDVIIVRAPSSIHPPGDGHVLIEHLSCTGRNDRIEHLVIEAVPLFWRFVIEKYGVHPVRPPAPGPA